MARLAELSVGEWVGLVGLVVFTSILVWSLVIGFKSPPDNRSK